MDVSPDELNKEACKACKKCGFTPDKYTEHFMKHQPAKHSYGRVIYREAMIFKCYRCKYRWELSLRARW